MNIFDDNELRDFFVLVGEHKAHYETAKNGDANFYSDLQNESNGNVNSADPIIEVFCSKNLIHHIHAASFLDVKNNIRYYWVHFDKISEDIFSKYEDFNCCQSRLTLSQYDAYGEPLSDTESSTESSTERNRKYVCIYFWSAWFEKAKEILGIDTKKDEHVRIELNFNELDMLKMFRMAHNENLSFNHFVQKLLMKSIEHIALEEPMNEV
jgi:hypothetical protein